ncbi:hypothetical protein [Microbacterium sp. PRC9]|uniref:hypothetical protein n=1 Tax=Microbacterium sp. PRC9 TaxID=2962591 RepID=UPI0037C728CC
MSAAEIDAAFSRTDAIEAITTALRAGWDIEHDHDRLFAPLTGGEFLLMPAESASSAGIKVATIAPGNTRRGLPKVHAWYLLFDRETLEPWGGGGGAGGAAPRNPPRRGRGGGAPGRRGGGGGGAAPPPPPTPRSTCQDASSSGCACVVSEITP